MKSFLFEQPIYGKNTKTKLFYVIWCLFITNKIIFLTHVSHMCNVRNERYAYGIVFVYV